MDSRESTKPRLAQAGGVGEIPPLTLYQEAEGDALHEDLEIGLDKINYRANKAHNISEDIIVREGVSDVGAAENCVVSVA